MSIDFNNVSKKYSNSTEFVLENINLHIKDGEFFLILGESGSGKTTLLKMINGLEMPTSGSVSINDKKTSESDLIDLRRSIGYCVQGSMLFPNMTAQENIAFVPTLSHQNNSFSHAISKKLPSYIDTTYDLAKQVQFPLDLLDRYPQELSGGQQQRVAIARALAANGNIFLADEPFSVLDPIVRNNLQNLVLELHSKNHYTTIMVTHNISEALKLADRICIIHDKKIEQIGTPSEIINSPATDYVRELTSINEVTLKH